MFSGVNSWPGILRPSHELTIFACNYVILRDLAEAFNSNDFVDPMLMDHTLNWYRPLKAFEAVFRR